MMDKKGMKEVKKKKEEMKESKASNGYGYNYEVNLAHLGIKK